MDINIECAHCHKTYTFKVEQKDYVAWDSGTVLIQDAMPYLTAGERELLVSATCDTCWDRLFTFNADDNEEAEDSDEDDSCVEDSDDIEEIEDEVEEEDEDEEDED